MFVFVGYFREKFCEIMYFNNTVMLYVLLELEVSTLYLVCWMDAKTTDVYCLMFSCMLYTLADGRYLLSMT